MLIAQGTFSMLVMVEMADQTALWCVRGQRMMATRVRTFMYFTANEKKCQFTGHHALCQFFPFCQHLCNQNLRRGLGTRFETTHVVSLVPWPHQHHGPHTHTHTLEGKIPTTEGLFYTCQSIVSMQRQHSLSHQMHQALSSG